MNKVDLSGMKYGMWTVLKKSNKAHGYWLCATMPKQDWRTSQYGKRRFSEWLDWLNAAAVELGVRNGQIVQR